MPFSRTNKAPLVVQVVIMADGSFGAVTGPWGHERDITKAQHDAVLLLNKWCSPPDYDENHDPTAEALTTYGAHIYGSPPRWQSGWVPGQPPAFSLGEQLR